MLTLMPRFEKQKQGTPDRKARNPFTGEPIVIAGIPGWVRFWEIAVRDRSVIVRYGQEGRSARCRWVDCPSEAEAHALAASLTARCERQGFAPVQRRAVVDVTPPARSFPHEAVDPAIVAAPDDPSAYDALGHALARANHPRAKLIAAQRAGDASAAARILAAHAQTLLGPLAPYVRTLDEDGAEAFTWRWGFIQKARVSVDGDAHPGEAAADVVFELLSHPSGAYVRELTLARARTQGWEWDYGDALGAIALAGPATLSRLFVGDFAYPDDTEISWAKLGDASLLWAALPALEDVTFQGAEAYFGEIDAPRLRRFEVKTGGLPQAALRSIAAARWPELESLIVWLGDPDYGGDGTPEDVAPILTGRGLPKLSHLGLMNCAFTDALCEMLVAGPVLARLASLDLSLGVLTNEGADVILKNAKRFEHLGAFCLRFGDVDARRRKALTKLCTAVDTSGSRSGNRFVAVGE